MKVWLIKKKLMAIRNLVDATAGDIGDCQALKQQKDA